TSTTGRALPYIILLRWKPPASAPRVAPRGYRSIDLVAGKWPAPGAVRDRRMSHGRSTTASARDTPAAASPILAGRLAYTRRLGPHRASSTSAPARGRTNRLGDTSSRSNLLGR